MDGCKMRIVLSVSLRQFCIHSDVVRRRVCTVLDGVDINFGFGILPEYIDGWRGGV